MAKRKTRRERRTFSDEYKQQVLELVSVGDKSVSQICRDLDLTHRLFFACRSLSLAFVTFLCSTATWQHTLY